MAKLLGFGLPALLNEAADDLECKDAEIASLRAVLESFDKDPPATLDEPDEDCEVIVKMRSIARAALLHTNGEHS
jgi:hypothetical protein